MTKINHNNNNSKINLISFNHNLKLNKKFLYKILDNNNIKQIFTQI